MQKVMRKYKNFILIFVITSILIFSHNLLYAWSDWSGWNSITNSMGTTKSCIKWKYRYNRVGSDGFDVQVKFINKCLGKVDADITVYYYDTSGKRQTNSFFIQLEKNQESSISPYFMKNQRPDNVIINKESGDTSTNESETIHGGKAGDWSKADLKKESFILGVWVSKGDTPPSANSGNIKSAEWTGAFYFYKNNDKLCGKFIWIDDWTHYDSSGVSFKFETLEFYPAIKGNKIYIKSTYLNSGDPFVMELKIDSSKKILSDPKGKRAKNYIKSSLENLPNTKYKVQDNIGF